MITSRVGLWGVDHTVAARPGAKRLGGPAVNAIRTTRLMLFCFECGIRTRAAAPIPIPSSLEASCRLYEGLAREWNGWE